MTHILALSPVEVSHAVRRFRAYGNSPRAIARHFRRRGESACERICRRLHRLELELGIDLGALCGRFASRDEPGVSAFERRVLESLVQWGRPVPEGLPLLIHVDRVRGLNALVERRTVELRAAALLSSHFPRERADLA